MTYFESAADTRITRKRALAEVDKHGCDRMAFLLECGECESYDAQAVLLWLGY